LPSATGCAKPVAAFNSNLDLLRRRLFLAKAERIDTAQLRLEFAEKRAALDAISLDRGKTISTVYRNLARVGKRCAVVAPRKINMSNAVVVMTGARRPEDLPPAAMA
jgi:hypothetical protein